MDINERNDRTYVNSNKLIFKRNILYVCKSEQLFLFGVLFKW